MQVSLWKRGGVYWTYVYLDGIRHSKSTGTGIRKKAEVVDKAFKDELYLGAQGMTQPQPEMRFAELAARFLSEGEPRSWHIDRLKPLLPYWGDIRIGRIHKSMAADYRRYRHAAKTVTDTTINRDLEALRHILMWAVDEGIVTVNPLNRLRMVPERRKPRTVLAIDEEMRLLETTADHLKPIVIAALDTGMRRGELLYQRWEHIDWGRKLLFVSKSKTAGGEGREIPLTERVHQLLFADRQQAGLLFTYRGKSIHKIKTAWKAAIRRAGIRYLRFHDLRHTFNTRLMEAGVMQEIRKALMGHSSGEDVNSIYTHVELPAKREAIRKLEVWIREQIEQLTRKEDANGKLAQDGADRESDSGDHRDGGAPAGKPHVAPGG